MLTIRPAQASDHSEILRLWHQGWHDAHAALVPPDILAFRTMDHFATWLAEARDAFYVAVDTELRGFVSVKDAEIVKLYVGRNARGQGIAQKLLRFAEQTLSENGVREAELFCTAGNSRAENFYLREGWTLSETFADYLWMPEGIAIRFVVQTHRFLKNLPTAA